ncbi:MAG: 30S ribosomal protein S16 [Gemmatimonadota bacterium]
MATRIRLSRVGRKRQASFRIVVAGSMHAAGGRITETIGKYNPRTHPSYIEVNEERALYWLRQGAKMSESVGSLFRKTGILKKLAQGAEGAGVVTIGDPNGKTITADRPGAKKSKKATAAEAAATEAAAEPEAAGPEAAVEEAAPEAEAEAGAAETAAEPEAEPEEKDEGS